jgi:hypothetical protein
MATMGNYCKAYPLHRFREFNGWQEKEQPAPGDKEQGTEDRQDFLFLQENLVVTQGIFLDEGIVFDAITPNWERFCADVLKFEVPQFEACSTTVEQVQSR